MRTGHRSKRTEIEKVSQVASETARRCIIGEDLVPKDLVIEILRRLPVKIIARFLLVSKLWSTIIRSQDFISSFPFNSPPITSQPPGLLFAVKNFDKTGHHDWNFYLPSSSTSAYCLSSTKPQIPSHCDVHYVNGLISLGYGQQQIITNPSTGKSITLPKVKTREEIIKSFFGYDPINFQYKVLCISDIPSFKHHVFTLGGVDKRSWRTIECNILHHPKTNGVCINGVLYYGASTGTDMLEWCLMRFDVRTENLNLFSRLNENVQSSPYLHPSLINYHEKVALAFEGPLHTFDLWVMDQDAEKWSTICFSIYPWSDLFDNAALRIIGTIHTGEIVFVPYDTRRMYGVVTHRVVYYDHKRELITPRSVVLHLGNRILISSLVVPFFNYVESAMLL